MANSSFFKSDGQTTTLQTNLEDKAADAEKLAINPEDDQFTLSDGTTTGYSALHHKEKAIDAQTAAEAARDASQAARDLSQTYRNTAEDHKDDAETAKVAAEAAKVAAETAETNAETAETNAQASEDEAEAWASKTDGEAVTGEGYSAKAHAVGGTGVTNSTGAAKEWATKAEDSTVDGSEYSAKHYSAKASASASTASTKASEASTSAAAAAASQTAAAASAASAANTYDQFDDRYLGTKSSDPSTDNDGNALVEGALYFSSTDNAMQVYDGSEWIAASSAGSVSITETHFTATAGQTTFNVSYTVDNLVVIMNGVVLQNGASKDYTATNGTSFTLASGASAGDELHVIVFKSFTTADMVSKTNGGAYSGSVDFTGGLEINGTAVTATAAELNLLDGVTATTAELNYVDGVTSNIQTQIDNISTDVVSDTTPQLGGDLSTNGNDVNFGDNDKAKFGAVGDLEIYHDGSDSYIKDLGTGDLKLGGNQLQLNNAAQTKNYLYAVDGAQVELKHNNSKKLETTSTGVTVTGTVTATSFSGDGSSLTGISSDVVDDTSPQLGGVLQTNGNNIEFPDSTGAENNRLKFGTGDDLNLYHDGTNSVIEDAGTDGLLYISTAGSAIQLNKGGSEKMADFHTDGSVELYHNNAKKFETTSTGVQVAGRVEVDQVTAPTVVLDSTAANDTAMAPYISFQRGGSEKAWIGYGTSANNHFRINQGLNGPLTFYTNGTERMAINGAGNWTKAPPGTVLQAVHLHHPGNTSNTSSQLASSSGTFQDFLAKSITTKASSSKIYVVTYGMHYSGGFVMAHGRLMRNSTQIDYCRYQLYQPGGSFISFGFQMLDSPNVAAGTTLTYKHQIAAQTGTYMAGYGDTAGKVNSNMILMEVAN